MEGNQPAIEPPAFIEGWFLSELAPIVQSDQPHIDFAPGIGTVDIEARSHRTVIVWDMIADSVCLSYSLPG